jgi:peptidoglycan/xylan/chitin deacetylase (PgdA/CDA1 family)
MLPKRFFLNFHGLGDPARPIDGGERPYWLPVSVFRETLDRVPEFKARGIDLEFTFDDGNLSDIAHAVPLLAERGRTAGFFVLAGRIDQPGSLSVAQIREMSEAGMTIGSHGWDHVDWRQASPDELRRELADSRARIEDAAGLAVTAAAVPFGLFDARVVAAAKAAGYSRIFTSSGGFTYSVRGLIPRTSPRQGFTADKELDALTGLDARMDSAWRDPMRRFKHGGW